MSCGFAGFTLGSGLMNISVSMILMRFLFFMSGTSAKIATSGGHVGSFSLTFTSWQIPIRWILVTPWCCIQNSFLKITGIAHPIIHSAR